MNIHDFRLRCSYDEWATRRLLAAVAQLESGDRTRDLRAGFGSIHGTLVHLLIGEVKWVRFLRDGADAPWLDAETVPDVPALLAVWAEVHCERRAVLDRLTEQGLTDQRLVRGSPFTVGELLEHMLLHSVHHRGQVSLLLRQLGLVPPPMEFRLYLSEQRGSGPA